MIVRSYSIHHVPKTNLMLLVVDSLCYCPGRINAEPIELSHILYCDNSCLLVAGCAFVRVCVLVNIVIGGGAKLVNISKTVGDGDSVPMAWNRIWRIEWSCDR